MTRAPTLCSHFNIIPSLKALSPNTVEALVNVSKDEFKGTTIQSVTTKYKSFLAPVLTKSHEKDQMATGHKMGCVTEKEPAA